VGFANRLFISGIPAADPQQSRHNNSNKTTTLTKDQKQITVGKLGNLGTRSKSQTQTQKLNLGRLKLMLHFEHVRGDLFEEDTSQTTM